MRYLGRLRNKKTSKHIRVDNGVNPTAILLNGMHDGQRIIQLQMQNGALSEERGNAILSNMGREYWEYLGNDDNFDTITGKLPVFEIKFTLSHFVPTNSGGYIALEDVETGLKYPIYNYEIDTMVNAITKPNVSSYVRRGDDGYFVGLFTTKNSGSQISLRLLDHDKEELQFLEE